MLWPCGGFAVGEGLRQPGWGQQAVMRDSLRCCLSMVLLLPALEVVLRGILVCDHPEWWQQLGFL
jgi:hypothetical protein